MNPEIQKELLGWLQALRQTVESGAAFAKEQIPLVLWEKILLDRVFYLVTELLCVAIMVVGTYYITKMWRWSKSIRWDDQPLTSVITIAVFLPPTIVFFENLYPALQVWFAPRLYLLEWVKGMVSK